MHLTTPWAVLTLLITGLYVSATSSTPTLSSSTYNNSSSISQFPTSTGTPTNASQIQQAEQLLASAVAQQGIYNAYRVANPRRNTYTKGTSASQPSKREDSSNGPQPPVLDAKLLAAAALVAEKDAKRAANGTLQNKGKRDTAATSSNWWLPAMSGNGLPPMGYDSSYPVYRDVTAYGAKGDGVTDDTQAINAAIAAHNNCGENCLSSSVKGTLIYFPPGTYLISSPIIAFYYSQLVGDVHNPPTIKTSASFVGLGAISTDTYYPNGKGNEWYIEQSVFFRQVRNFVIDISGTTTASVAGLHWQVAQATSLTNVVITCSTAAGNGNTQMGMFTENGSGGFMSDVTIRGGAYGIYGGNQQYTVRDFKISGQTKACICLIWDWGWTWTGMQLSNAPIGVSLINPQDTTGQVSGSTYLMDSSFSNIQTGIYADFNQTILDSSIITLDNIQVTGVSKMMGRSDGGTVNVPNGNIQFLVVGDVEDNGQLYGSYSYQPPTRPSSLTTSDHIVQKNYFAKSRPQYETLSTGQVINVKSLGARGDGASDDTAAIQAAFSKATTSNLIYFPAGSYIITSTLIVPPNIRMTGSVWSQLVASGSYFANLASPKVMLQVGKVGDVGTVEISDMLFTSKGALPGLILVEWNVAAAIQGSVGIWDSHFRVGGAYGTQLQVAQCPLQGGLPSSCVGANMMLHVTGKANGYFENMWAWVADHDIDDAQNTMVAVAVARGILVESQGPSWFYGSASEHSMLYQYNFAGSKDTFAGMIQTESPYFQSTQSGQSPGPFSSSVGQYANDPTFKEGTCRGTLLQCNVSWAVMAQKSTNLIIAGAGLYSWFGNFVQACVDTQNCQQRLFFDDGQNSGLQLWNLITIGSVEMISSRVPGGTLLAKPHTQSIGHPFWSALAGYLDSSKPIVLSCLDNDPDPQCQDASQCDLTQSYPTFDALNNAENSIPNECVDYFAMDTMSQVLSNAVSSYSDANNGYDAVFGYYVEYMKDLIPEAISDAMTGSSPNNINGGAGNPFFTCHVKGDNIDVTDTCPIKWGDKRVPLGASFTMTYTLNDPNGFYNVMQTQYGIDKSWIAFGTQQLGLDNTGPGCGGGAHDQNCSPKIQRTLVNIPVAAQNLKIPNPKDVVTQALPSVGKLQNNILAAQIDMNTGGWNSSTDDPLQAYSVPVFLLDQSIQSMENAKKLGQQQKKEDKIKLIIEILGAVFAVIPFLDDLTPDLLVFDGLANTISIIGNTALAIQDIVSNPKDAPMAILGLLGSGLGKTEDEIADIANARRAIPDTDLSALGKGFKADDDSMQAAIKEKCEF